MKKIISIISALTFFTTIPILTYAAEKDDPELYQKAYSPGADKDYLSIINYSHNEERPLNEECYKGFLEKCSILEAAYGAKTKFKELSSDGLCMGIAMIEVLSHNGVISPSDIKEGASSLKDITYDENADNVYRLF
ncbi:hypothetical protein [Ruminococcus sp.]|jgi:hypothetical protein|uniref:hypothetical protein n=1 Tax=Ruminococcus sp. TaxID=41978 RepID=UPI0025F56D6E|nr:hypothetical protein [Ruminococcus sp.]